MLAFRLRRLVQSVAVLLAVGLVSFFLFRYVGDPINSLVGQDTPAAEREALKEKLGLNDPAPVQFFRFIQNAARGRFGLSYRTSEPVNRMILERMPATLELSFCAAVVALLVGIPVGFAHRHLAADLPDRHPANPVLFRDPALVAVVRPRPDLDLRLVDDQLH